MFCRKCGRENPDDARFCQQCGTDLNAPVAPQPVPPPPEPQPFNPTPQFAPPPAYNAGVTPPPKSNTGLIVGILAAVFGLILLCVLGYFVISMARKAGEPAGPANATDVTGSTATTSAPAAGKPVGGEVLKYVTSAANIRDTATTQGSKVVGNLRRGDQVKGVMYQGLAGGTYWFKLSDGRGFVSAVNLGDADPGPTPPSPAAMRVAVAGAPFCQVATSSGNLRIRAAPDGAIIGGMPRGARFQAYNGEHGADGTEWLMVQPAETRYPIGWVSAAYVVC